MLAEGYFDVTLTAKEDLSAPAGRMLIEKSYQGGMEGTGLGQMISKRTEKGVSLYFAIEEFKGRINGKEGALTFVHKGVMDKDSETLKIEILAGSATGALEGIKGEVRLNIDKGRHFYVLDYEF